MEIEYDDLVEKIFKSRPQSSKSITLDFVERLSLTELFEFLLSLFTDGSKMIYGETKGDKVIVDLNKWSQDNLKTMKDYFEMIGFNLNVSINEYNPTINYENLMYRKLGISEETKLSELKMVLRNNNKVYIINFEFL